MSRRSEAEGMRLVLNMQSGTYVKDHCAEDINAEKALVSRV